MRTLKAFFSKLQNFRQTLQEKRAKREPNARVVKAVAFMNRYSILFHGILSCLLCFVIECISRRSFSAVSKNLLNPRIRPRIFVP